MAMYATLTNSSKLPQPSGVKKVELHGFVLLSNKLVLAFSYDGKSLAVSGWDNALFNALSGFSAAVVIEEKVELRP